MPTNDEYADYMAQLQLLAQQDLAAWWANTEGNSPPVRMDTMREAFDSVQRTYGEQAAYAAAEHLFLNRQLDEALAGREFPAVARPAEYEQARAGFNWATQEYRRNFDPAMVAAAKSKLDGVLVRLVAQPAHETEIRAVLDAGTGYARIPEPGACDFCLMLASRGAAYSRESVVGLSRFHDNCRCVGIEVKDDSQLPQINQELQNLWNEAGNEDAFKDLIRERRTPTGRRVSDDNAKAVALWKTDKKNVDSTIASQHIHRLTVKKGTIRGGHSYQLIQQVQNLVRSGNTQMSAGVKTFFPDVPASALDEWLRGQEGVSAVLRDPDVVKHREIGPVLVKRVTGPDGNDMDLAVQLAPTAVGSRYDLKVTSVYPLRGTGVYEVNNQGQKREVTLQDGYVFDWEED